MSKSAKEVKAPMSTVLNKYEKGMVECPACGLGKNVFKARYRAEFPKCPIQSAATAWPWHCRLCDGTGTHYGSGAKDCLPWDGVCEVCGSSEEKPGNELMICSWFWGETHCDKGWHQKCLRPQVFAIPEGHWYCPAKHELPLTPARKSKTVKKDQPAEAGVTTTPGSQSKKRGRPKGSGKGKGKGDGGGKNKWWEEFEIKDDEDDSQTGRKEDGQFKSKTKRVPKSAQWQTPPASEDPMFVPSPVVPAAPESPAPVVAPASLPQPAKVEPAKVEPPKEEKKEKKEEKMSGFQKGKAMLEFLATMKASSATIEDKLKKQESECFQRLESIRKRHEELKKMWSDCTKEVLDCENELALIRKELAGAHELTEHIEKMDVDT